MLHQEHSDLKKTLWGNPTKKTVYIIKAAKALIFERKITP